jgi:hypothetical protein
MRRIFSGIRHRVAALAVVTVLLIPVAGIADDSQIRPPQPQSVLQPAQPSLWHTLLVVVAHVRFLPLVG